MAIYSLAWAMLAEAHNAIPCRWHYPHDVEEAASHTPRHEFGSRRPMPWQNARTVLAYIRGRERRYKSLNAAMGRANLTGYWAEYRIERHSISGVPAHTLPFHIRTNVS